MSAGLALTDIGNAKRFATQRGANDAIYVPGIGWFIWDGIRWVTDRGGYIMELAKMTAEALFAEAVSAEKDMKAWAMKSQDRSRLTAMLELAKSDLGVVCLSDNLDQNPWLLNCTNCTINLTTGEGGPASRTDWLTRACGVAYDTEAKCPTWLQFLHTVMQGDEVMIAYLQRAAGYALTGSVREDALFILHGGGANGKTTFITAIMDIMGEYATKIPIDALLSKNKSDIPCDIAMLRGARMASASESEEGRRLSEATVKSLTSRDKKVARFMHQNFFEFTPTHKLWMDTNHKPHIRGNDYGLWRRVHLIPWEVTIPKEHQDKDLADKLKLEYPGILNWLVQGCLAWQRDGLGAPEKVIAATELYRKEMDSIGAFLDEECVKIPGVSIASSELYRAYAVWAKENGEFPRSNKAFSLAVSDRGFVKKVTMHGKVWQDLDLAHQRVNTGPWASGVEAEA